MEVGVTRGSGAVFRPVTCGWAGLTSFVLCWHAIVGRTISFILGAAPDCRPDPVSGYGDTI